MKVVIIFIIGTFFAVATPFHSHAQEVHQDLKEIVSAEIVEVISEEEREIVGTDTSVHLQMLKAEILEGTQKGRVVEFENEIVELQEGDVVYLNYLKTINGDEYFLFKDFKRHVWLWALGGLFVGVLLVFSRWHGLRALLSLALSIGAIIFVLVPLLLKGYDPVLISLCVSALILAFVLFVTHGLNAKTTIAFFGTFCAVAVTCFVAWASVSLMRLTGFGSDASVSLNFATYGTLDFSGLLLGSIIIGILGMLDDVSITQVSVVRELKRANISFGVRELYTRALTVGRDHIGSLVNTLALAYVGVSLPLVLLFVNADAPLSLTLNQEVVASEFVRIVVGSLGIILTVPLTTFLSALYFAKREVKIDEEGHSSSDHHHHH